MISTKKLIKMARKWRKIAAASRKRVSGPPKMANEGHFVIYTADGKRFMIPLSYLQNDIFIELLRIAEEEYGVTSSEPIKLPIDSKFMEYAMSMVQRCVAKELEKALIASLSSCKYSSSHVHQEQTNPQMFCSF